MRFSLSIAGLNLTTTPSHPLLFFTSRIRKAEETVVFLLYCFRRGVMIFSFVDHVYRVNIRTPFCLIRCR